MSKMKQILAKIPNKFKNKVLEKEKKPYEFKSEKKELTTDDIFIPTFSKYLFHALNDCFLVSPFS